MASYEGSAITIEELNRVLTSLKKQREIISNEYKNNIHKVLETSSSCISVSGLDMTSVNSAFESTFTTLDRNFDMLISVLENNVIKNYSELAEAIRRLFGPQFASQISDLLGI